MPGHRVRGRVGKRAAKRVTKRIAKHLKKAAAHAAKARTLVKAHRRKSNGFPVFGTWGCPIC